MLEVDTGVKFKTQNLLTIGNLAQASGVSTRSVRYYEEQGLLASRRTGSGHRRFEPECVDRIILIQRMFAAGLNSPTIKMVLPCMLDEAQRTDFLIDELRRHSERLRREISHQQEAVRILEEVIEDYD